MFLHNRWKQRGLRDGSKFWGVHAAGRHGFYRRYDVLVSAAASWLLSFLVCGVWVQVRFDASESRHELLSASAWPDACMLWARWHIPAETGRLVAAVRLWWMWRRWLTEGRSGQQLVCARPSCHGVTQHYCLTEESSESDSSAWLSAIQYSCVDVPHEMIQKQFFNQCWLLRLFCLQKRNISVYLFVHLAFVLYRTECRDMAHTPTEVPEKKKLMVGYSSYYNLHKIYVQFNVL